MLTMKDHCAVLKLKVRDYNEKAEHVRDMLDKIPTMTNVSKMNRWLGFVHGYLWMAGLVTIDELRSLTKGTETNVATG